MPQKMVAVIFPATLQSSERDKSLESVYGRNILKECGDELIKKRYRKQPVLFWKIATLKKFTKL